MKILKNKFITTTILACIAILFIVLLLHAFFPKKYIDKIESVCKNTQINKEFALAIIKAESSFKNDKTSPKGAKGLMQIMPETAKYVSDIFFAGEDFDLFNENENILIGVSYLIYLTNKFSDKKTVLCAYNAGEGRVYEWLDNIEFSKDGKTLYKIPYRETENYVKKVLVYERIYKILI